MARVDRTNLVGRPQKHAKLTLDMSGVETLVGEHGEKPVRLAAFSQVRESLGLGADVVITRHPKDESAWVIKGSDLAEDVLVTVTPV